MRLLCFGHLATIGRLLLNSLVVASYLSKAVIGLCLCLRGHIAAAHVTTLSLVVDGGVQRNAANEVFELAQILDMLYIRLGRVQWKAYLVEDHLHCHEVIRFARVGELEQLEEISVVKVLLERAFV